MGKPWAMTKKDVGCSCQPGYTSHYTVVGNNFLPVASGQNIRGDEIVIFDSSHVLPRYILKYSINTAKKTF
jgi:hypothetical protein